MEKILVEGGHPLYGEVAVSGMKNSVLPIIYASLLVKDECIIHNVPRVSDVYNSLEILKSIGADAEFCDRNSIRINAKNANGKGLKEELVRKMRASSYLMGVLLSRYGSVDIPLPGGCNFGARPLDLHIKGFEMLGAECAEENDRIKIISNKKLKSNKITLDKISVGATINMVLASALIDGITVIQNCAKEPHIDDLICFLNNCGARIIRQDNTIFCNGVSSLHGTEYTIFPDMIEALTFVCAVGICQGEVHIKGVNPEHISYELPIFESMGYRIDFHNRTLAVRARQVFGVNVETAPYPLFPTDIHPQFSALLCYANGGGAITDAVFPTRFAYVDQLIKMGADIVRKSNTVYIRKSDMRGALLDATDLRAGAALVLAALGASGVSTINNVNYIVRGYEDFVCKIANIGGKIKLI